EGSREWRILQRGLELGELALPLHDLQAAAHHRDPGGVVSAIREAPEPFQHDGEGVVGADVAHDAAHEATRVAGGSGGSSPTSSAEIGARNERTPDRKRYLRFA